MRRFEINRVSGVFESRDTTEILLDSTAGRLLIVFRRGGGDLLDGVASALTALKTDGAESDALSAPGLSKALEHLREALTILEAADRETFTGLLGRAADESSRRKPPGNLDET